MAATVLVRCAADFDDDGAVDADDLASMIACYFEAVPCSRADFDRSGEVNADDLSDLITAYFSVCR